MRPLSVKRDSARLGFLADPSVRIVREELYVAEGGALDLDFETRGEGAPS